jgi:PAS domain-containing protein
MAAQLGHDIERDVLGHHFQEFLHEQDIPPTLQKWETGNAGEPLRNHEYRVRHVDGSWRRYSANAEPIRAATAKSSPSYAARATSPKSMPKNGCAPKKNRLESIARLAGGIAPRIQQYARVILGHLDLIEEETEPSVDSKEEHIEEIRAAVARSSSSPPNCWPMHKSRPKCPGFWYSR